MGAVRGTMREGNNRLKVLMGRYEESHGPTQIQSRTAPRIAPLRRMDRSRIGGANTRKGFFSFTPNDVIRRPAVRVAVAASCPPPPPPVDGPKPPIFLNPPTKYNYNNGWKGLKTYLTMVQQSGGILGRKFDCGEINALSHEAVLDSFRLEGYSLTANLKITSRYVGIKRPIDLAFFWLEYQSLLNQASSNLAKLISRNTPGIVCEADLSKDQYQGLSANGIYSVHLNTYPKPV